MHEEKNLRIEKMFHPKKAKFGKMAKFRRGLGPRLQDKTI